MLIITAQQLKSLGEDWEPLHCLPTFLILSCIIGSLLICRVRAYGGVQQVGHFVWDHVLVLIAEAK